MSYEKAILLTRPDMDPRGFDRIYLGSETDADALPSLLDIEKAKKHGLPITIVTPFLFDKDIIKFKHLLKTNNELVINDLGALSLCKDRNIIIGRLLSEMIQQNRFESDHRLDVFSTYFPFILVAASRRSEFGWKKNYAKNKSYLHYQKGIYEKIEQPLKCKRLVYNHGMENQALQSQGKRTYMV